MKSLEKLRDFLDSEEGKKSLQEFAEKMARAEAFKDRWVQKFKKRAESNMDEALEKILNKYDSPKYRDKEYSLGYEPRESLLWIALEYAKKYCEECVDEKYLNMFTGEAYYIGSYVIQVMHGQGSVVRLEKIKE